MQRILSIVNHRDFVLTLALIMGFLLGEKTQPLAELSVYSLALVMVFSTTGFSFRSWYPPGPAVRTFLHAAFLNFVLFGLLLILFGWLFFSSEHYFPFYIGLVLVAASPPGPSVIPFSSMLQGDNAYAVTGVFGLHLLAIVLSPLMLLLFLGQSLINPFSIVEIMAKLIILPLIISRILRHPKVLPGVEKIRNTVVKWGFFLVIAPIVGMSASLFVEEPLSVLKIAAVVFLMMFVPGIIYHLLMIRLGKSRSFIISSTLMMVIKSSAFAAVTAFTFFSGDAGVALPAAVVSVFVTLFIIFYSFVVRLSEKKFKKK